jgi:hypothetical protein
MIPAIRLRREAAMSWRLFLSGKMGRRPNQDYTE